MRRDNTDDAVRPIITAFINVALTVPLSRRELPEPDNDSLTITLWGRSHTITYDEWTYILWRLSPTVINGEYKDGYTTPDQPETPMSFTQQEARAKAMRDRLAAGTAIWHPDDATMSDVIAARYREMARMMGRNFRKSRFQLTRDHEEYEDE